MTRQILLVRHGRSAHVHRGWLSRDGLESWRQSYDAAGLMAGESPPAAVRNRVNAMRLVVSSDLPRAIESASLLRPEPPYEQSPLLRETPLPIPSIGMKLPLWVWGLLISLSWFRDPDTAFVETRARSLDAARWLNELATAHGSIAVVTHGAFRRYLAESLVQDGWTSIGRRSYTPWSVWELLR